MTIYVLSGFNNYYNRVVKKFDTVSEYEQFILHTQENYNFVPNDNVNTKLVLGNLGNQYTGEGDYLLVVNEFNEIVSRWFIIESVRDRAGQYTLTLHRDLVADHYDELIDAPMFIEKATLNYNDPLVFNKEDMTLNQIKTTETLLKDKSGCAWIVGYYDKNQETLETSVPLNLNTNIYKMLDVPITSSTLWNYCDNNQNGTYYPGELTKAEYVIDFKVQAGILGQQEISVISNWKTGDTYSEGPLASNWATEATKINSRFEDQYTEEQLSTMSGMLSDNSVPGNTQDNLNTTILQYVGKTIQDVDGKVFKIQLLQTKTLKNTTNIVAGNLYNEFVKVMNGAGFIPSENSKFSVRSETMGYQLHLEDITNQQGITITFQEGRLKTEDAPWNIFAIPYGKVKVYQYPESFLLETNEDMAIKTAMAIAKQQKAYLYDIQLLPYCPIPNAVREDNTMYVVNNNEFSVVSFKDENDVEEYVSIAFHVPSSKFNTIVESNVSAAQSAIEKKVNNECDKWRLTAPNYSNYFDFSVEKNNGIEYFDVDCIYKPHTPYIHLNPNFKELYGYDDNSPRGLVLGGDFSLDQITDQWIQYQAQNKNFQATFDRQIQNMEINNSIGRTQDIVGTIAGIGQGAAAGGLTGSMIPGIGTGIGAIAGGVTSAIGGVADIFINEQLRNETLDYTKDLFGYQLGNIQALPNTISKVSAYNNNNKIFPVLEYYTCTNREKEALLNKIAYNGMTVMAIGKIKDYLGNSWSYNDITSKGYIKGKLIRLETVEDDYHIINEISNELNKGVYI